MYPRHLFIILGAIVGVLFVVVIVQLLQPSEVPSPGFENTTKDGLSKMLSILKEYEDILESYDDDDTLPEGNYYDNFEEYELQNIYVPEDESSYPKPDDTRYLSTELNILSTIQYVVNATKSMSLYCIGYSEGETCRFLFQKKWVELYLSDDDILYINYYVHLTSNFLYERDEWINYEIYLYKIDDIAHIDAGINSYNILTGFNNETAYYLKDQTYLKSYTVYGEESYQYRYLDLETRDSLSMSYDGHQTETTYYNYDDEIYMSFNDSEPMIGFEYQVFLDREDLFYYSSETEYLRYNLWYVTGWDTLQRETSDEYTLFINNISYPDIVARVSDFPTITPYMYLQMNPSDMTETSVNLTDYGLESTITLEDIQSARIFYFGTLNDILASQGLSKQDSSNYHIIASYIINRDDSDQIS